MRVALLVIAIAVVPGTTANAEEPPQCRVLCAPEFTVEPTLTFTNLFRGARVVREGGMSTREERTREVEVILSLGLPTRAPWLDFTVEAIFLPFDRESTPELEFETNFRWLSAERTRGWVSSHLDVVDKFSAAEGPDDRRAYTHKLNLELDTGVAIFNRLPPGRWMRGIEVEGSLDFVATGLPRAGDTVGGTRYVDKASPWSFSIILVIPVAPF